MKTETSSEKPPKKRIIARDYVSFLDKTYNIKENLITGQIEVDGVPMKDSLRQRIRHDAHNIGLVDRTLLNDMISYVAGMHEYNPLHEYLNGLKYSKPAIDDFCDRVFDYEDKSNAKTYTEAFKYFLTNAVRKAFIPTQNIVLILEGRQEIGKSTFVEWLCPLMPYDDNGDKSLFAERTQIEPGSKDADIYATQDFLVEISEFGHTLRKSDRENLKSFITKKKAKIRRPFGKDTETIRIISSYIATINPIGGYLDDPTGNRRYFAIPLENINMEERLRTDVNLLWAEAKHLYDKGEYSARTKGMVDIQKRQAEGNSIDYPLESFISKSYEVTGNPDDFVSRTEILTHIQENGYKASNTNTIAKEIIHIITANGISHKKNDRATVNGERMFIYKGIRSKRNKPNQSSVDIIW